MRRHGLAVAIQEYGVGLLASMLGNNHNRACASREFFDEEGISTVLAAMMIHPDHAVIQFSGCDVLIGLVVVEHNYNPYNLLEPEDSGAAAHYKQCITEDTNAIAVVRDAMERFPTQKYLQHRGSVLLRALSSTRTSLKKSVVDSLSSAAAASKSTALQSSSFLSSKASSILSSSSSRG